MKGKILKDEKGGMYEGAIKFGDKLNLYMLMVC